MVHYGRYGMLSLKDIAAVKIAIEVCNNPKLKSAMLFSEAFKENTNFFNNPYHLKSQWNRKIEKEAMTILKTLDLHIDWLETVLTAVLPIGVRMLTWAEYHGVILGFSLETSINLLNGSFFTQQGNIDSSKAAEWLINDKNLNIEQKYKLACIYCFTDQIPTLYKQMGEKNKTNITHSFKRFGLVELWSCFQMGRVQKVFKKESLDQYRLEQAIEIGSKAAVEYCLEKTSLQRNNDRILNAAVEVVNSRIISNNDWFGFRIHSHNGSETSWVPRNYYIDILCYLLSKMSVDQQRNFLKRDIEGVLYEESGMRSKVLEYFLNWPYQDYFMKMVELTWEFLPECNYVLLLIKLCDKIESEKNNNLYYFEEKGYNYKRLLKEFWCQSPERYRRYLFTKQEVKRVGFEANYLLLMKLLLLRNFTDEDEEIIRLILSCVTDQERANMMRSLTWTQICIACMRRNVWIILHRIDRTCFSSKKQANEFKRELIFKKETIRFCNDIVEKNKWSSAASFMKWSDLPKEELEKFKREMIKEK